MKKLSLVPIPRKIEYLDGTCNNTEIISNLFSADISHSEGYVLSITPDKIVIDASDKAGRFYALKTLEQIKMQYEHDEIPCLRITDWPDFPNRGLMLDVSRDRVPTMKSLFELIDMLASWKVNQLQLYFEHTFAYSDHEEVWKDSSPFTADEIQEIDAYCKERFIELVPFQNSFGHMHRWLKHDKYRHLAECPEGWPMAWSMGDDEPFSLCPTAPESLDFLTGLYDELLPNFSSNKFMIGCDETFDAGMGRSKEYCENIGGKGELYLEFLWKLYDLINAKDKRMMYFGDIIINYPELLSQLPKDSILMHWGYYIDFPYDEHCRLLAENNIPFYVLPSNAAYSSVAGRTNRFLGNIRNATFNGLKHGAAGVLLTEWGDNGHWHPPTVSIPGYLYGAAMSWCPEVNEKIDICTAVDTLVFKDEAGVLGKLLYDLGNCYLHTSKDDNQSSNLFMIAFKAQNHRNEIPFREMTLDELETTLKDVYEIMSRLDSCKLKCSDAYLVKNEVRMAGEFLEFCCLAGISFFNNDVEYMNQIPQEDKSALLAQLDEVMCKHKNNWLKRSRIGGLKESLWWFERVYNSIA